MTGEVGVREGVGLGELGKNVYICMIIRLDMTLKHFNKTFSVGMAIILAVACGAYGPLDDEHTRRRCRRQAPSPPSIYSSHFSLFLVWAMILLIFFLVTI